MSGKQEWQYGGGDEEDAESVVGPLAKALDAAPDPLFDVRARREVQRLDDLATQPAAAMSLCQLAHECTSGMAGRLLVRSAGQPRRCRGG